MNIRLLLRLSSLLSDLYESRLSVLLAFLMGTVMGLHLVLERNTNHREFCAARCQWNEFSNSCTISVQELPVAPYLWQIISLMILIYRTSRAVEG